MLIFTISSSSYLWWVLLSSPRCGTMASDDSSDTLEFTPTWVVAVVCSIIVAISLCAERLLHYLGKVCPKFLTFGHFRFVICWVLMLSDILEDTHLVNFIESKVGGWLLINCSRLEVLVIFFIFGLCQVKNGVDYWSGWLWDFVSSINNEIGR